MSEAHESLTPEQRQYAKAIFQARIYRSSGQIFENLFIAIMTKRDHRFRPVKPQGIIGDQGNDGFIPEIGRYFQVYSPENPAEKIQKAAEKARDDFAKLKDKWDRDYPIVDFRFVFNDKYQGAYPTVEHALAELKEKNGLQSSKPFLAKDLEDEFWKLSRVDQESVLEMVIPRREHIDDIDFMALTDILQHLVDNQTPVTSEGLPHVPDYENKIQFNQISTAAGLLRVGNYQNSAVDLFFNQHGEFTRKDIRDRLAHSYLQYTSEEEFNPGSENEFGDRVFFRMLENIAPKTTKQIQDAAIVLIAYFFEKCDVFEDPTS